MDKNLKEEEPVYAEVDSIRQKVARKLVPHTSTPKGSPKKWLQRASSLVDSRERRKDISLAGNSAFYVSRAEPQTEGVPVSQSTEAIYANVGQEAQDEVGEQEPIYVNLGQAREGLEDSLYENLRITSEGSELEQEVPREAEIPIAAEEPRLGVTPEEVVEEDKGHEKEGGEATSAPGRAEDDVQEPSQPADHRNGSATV